MSYYTGFYFGDSETKDLFDLRDDMLWVSQGTPNPLRVKEDAERDEFYHALCVELARRVLDANVPIEAAAVTRIEDWREED